MTALQGALVEIYSAGVLVTAGYTDANGQFTYPLMAGTYDIYISAPSMATIHKTVTITTNEELIVNLTTPTGLTLQTAPQDSVQRFEGLQISNAPSVLLDEYPFREEQAIISNSPNYIQEDNPPTELTREETIWTDNTVDQPEYEQLEIREELVVTNELVGEQVGFPSNFPNEPLVLAESMTYLNPAACYSSEGLKLAETVICSDFPPTPLPVGGYTTDVSVNVYCNWSEQMLVGDEVFADSAQKENYMQTNEDITCFYMTTVNERVGYETCLISETMSYVNH